MIGKNQVGGTQNYAPCVSGMSSSPRQDKKLDASIYSSPN